MKSSLTFTLALSLAVIGTIAQNSHSAQPKSPKEVVEHFWKLETEGGRLTTEGRENMAAFFVRPSLPSSERQIFVVYKDSTVSDPIIKGLTAEVTVDILPQGQIDPTLHFTTSESYKAGVLYHLVLTDKHWERPHGGDALKEAVGPQEWRIADTVPNMWLNVTTAIRKR